MKIEICLPGSVIIITFLSGKDAKVDNTEGIKAVTCLKPETDIYIFIKQNFHTAISDKNLAAASSITASACSLDTEGNPFKNRPGSCSPGDQKASLPQPGCL